MGNQTQKETESLIKKETFSLYCEQEGKKKEISVSEDGIRFTMRYGDIYIPYGSVREVKVRQMMPYLCKYFDFIYIGVYPERYYYFSGGDSCNLEKAILEKFPEAENFLC